KVLFCFGLVCGSTGAFALGLILNGALLDLIYGRGLMLRVPWNDFAAQMGRAAVTIAPMVCLQTWASIRYRGFPIPVGSGLAALVVGAFLAPLEALHSRVWYPWTLPMF